MLERCFMELPIIISENGASNIYESIEELQSDLEPADVLDQVYTSYDCKGRILFLSVKNGKVSVQDSDTEISDESELRRILIRYLAYVKVSLEWLNQATLAQLVEKRVAYEHQMNKST